jgi:two-component system cell cycle sensor histidine kinase/response regulator CckA
MGQQQHFLVVEDDPDVLTLMQRALESNERVVFISGSGRGGLQKFADLHGDLDLVIADVVLPDLSGPEMVRRMLQERPGLKVLFTTGYSDEVVQGYLSGLNRPLLHKPFTVPELRAAVETALAWEAPGEGSRINEAGAGLG